MVLRELSDATGTIRAARSLADLGHERKVIRGINLLFVQFFGSNPLDWRGGPNQDMVNAPGELGLAVATVKGLFRADLLFGVAPGIVERQVFALDPFGGQGADLGATRTQRSIILPQRPYQVLEEKQPPGFGSVRKFVVSDAGRVLQY